MATTLDPKDVLKTLGIQPVNDGAWAAGEWLKTSGPELESRNPATGEVLARVRLATRSDYEKVAASSVDAFHAWREWPAPKRGELVRDLAAAFRRVQEPLGALVTMEMGKILAEGKGEVQEVIDI